MKKLKTYYKRHLPHIQPIGACFFVTTRLAGTLPISVVKELQESYFDKIASLKLKKPADWQLQIYREGKRYFKKMDDYLDMATSNIRHLEQPEVAQIVINQLERFNGKCYDLIAYSIMPNHIYLVLDLSIQIKELSIDEDVTIANYQQLTTIMKRIKGASSRYANQFLGLIGQTFWDEESYDHYIRNQREFRNVVNYTINNAVKAGIVSRWEEHPFTWCKP